MTATHNAVKKNHYYLHRVFGRTWAILSHLYGEEDLKNMGLNEDFDWSAPTEEIQEGQGSFSGGQLIFFISRHR